jgi:hypothetical protein
MSLERGNRGGGGRFAGSGLKMAPKFPDAKEKVSATRNWTGWLQVKKKKKKKLK